jgi:thioesterase domain-containing protein
LPDRTVPRVAARFVAGLRDIQPQGPYYLGGLSFGGLLAFEMARQLQSSGQDVALLVLMDPVTSWRWSMTKSVRRLRPERGSDLNRVSLTRLLLRGLKRFFTDRYAIATAGIVRRDVMRQGQAIFKVQIRMVRRYALQPYSGRTLVLRTAEWKRFDERDITRSLSGRTRVAMTPGTHMSMLSETNLATMAAIIREEMARVDSPRVLLPRLRHDVD